MPALTRQSQKEIGLSPYALIYRGSKTKVQDLIRTISYNEENLEESEIKTLDSFLVTKTAKQITWLNIDGLNNPELMETISEKFGIEKNILSDIMNPSLRPKIEEMNTGVFISLKMLHYEDKKEYLSVDNLSLLCLDNLLISFQEQTGNFFDPIRERIRKHKNKIRTAGVDYLTFALIDVVVDNYIYAISLLGDKIEELDEKISSNPSKEILDEINFYKKELNFIRKHIKPVKELIFGLIKLDTDFIQKENRIHFKELQNNINEAIDLADSYHEIVYDLLNIYHSSVSTKLNEIMRVLTIISVIFIPITFLVGVYGTNFENIPEYHLKYGYALLWLTMIIISLLMIWFFKKKKWL